MRTTTAIEAGSPGGAPPPLGAVLARIDRAVADLAEGAQGREAMHALRSGLSDICALTEETPGIQRAIDGVVRAGDRLAEIAAPSDRPRRTQAQAGRLNAARRALARLDGTLAGARPSRIALSLGRGW